MKVKVTQSCLTLGNPMEYSPWNSPGWNTGVGSLSLLRWIFLSQESHRSPALQADSFPTELSRNPRRYQFNSWVRRIPWRRDGIPTPAFLSFLAHSDSKESTRNARDLGSIPGLGRSPGGGHGNPLQCFAWRTPWTEETGELQCIGSQRVGHS